MKKIEGLSPREIQVLQATADGYDRLSNTLGMAPRTFEVHWQNIHRKLKTHSRPAALAIGFRKGLLK
jgi:DNA-binding CsgD family transcriptional regulator